jgi:hypothetical protein
VVARLSQALIADNAELAIAASQGQSHPVIGLWRVAVPDALCRALAVEGLRNVGRWTARYRLATVAWAAHPLDPFFNTNTFDDLAEAERLAAIDDRALAAAPQGAKMRQKSGSEKQPAEDAIRDIRRATGRLFSAEEKIRVVLEGFRGEESIADGEGFGG